MLVIIIMFAPSKYPSPSEQCINKPNSQIYQLFPICWLSVVGWVKSRLFVSNFPISLRWPLALVRQAAACPWVKQRRDMMMMIHINLNTRKNENLFSCHRLSARSWTTIGMHLVINDTQMQHTPPGMKWTFYRSQ